MKEQTIWTKEEGWKEFVIISNSDVKVVEKEEKIKEEKMNKENVEAIGIELGDILFKIKNEVEWLGYIHNHIYYDHNEIDYTLSEDLLPEVMHDLLGYVDQVESLYHGLEQSL